MKRARKLSENVVVPGVTSCVNRLRTIYQKHAWFRMNSPEYVHDSIQDG
jgi:hypothetical protein